MTSDMTVLAVWLAIRAGLDQATVQGGPPKVVVELGDQPTNPMGTQHLDENLIAYCLFGCHSASWTAVGRISDNSRKEAAVLYIALHFATRIGTRIASFLARRNGPTDHVLRPTKSSDARKRAHIEESMADAWIRQHERVKEAIARAQSKNAPTEPAHFDDEWVNPWSRQQQRLKEAIAQAKRRNLTVKK